MGASLNGEDVAIAAVLANGSTGSSSGSDITVDSALSLTSRNPVQNNVVTAAINDVRDSCITKVDSALLTTSTNPVQNKVVTTEINAIKDAYLTKEVAENTYVKAGSGTYGTSGRYRGNYSPLNAYQVNDVIYYQGGDTVSAGYRYFVSALAVQGASANVDTLIRTYTQPFNLSKFNNDAGFITGSEVYSNYLSKSEAANTYALKGESGGASNVETTAQTLIYTESSSGSLVYKGTETINGTAYVTYKPGFASSTLALLEIDAYRHKYVFTYLGSHAYPVLKIRKGDSNCLGDATIFLKGTPQTNIPFTTTSATAANFSAYKRASATIGGIELFAPPEMEIID